MHQRTPRGVLRLDVIARLLERAAAVADVADVAELLDDRWIGHHRGHLAVDAGQDRLRHAFRRRQHEPAGEVEAGERLGDRRHVGEVRQALCRRDRERAKRAARDMAARDRRGDV